MLRAPSFYQTLRIKPKLDSFRCKTHKNKIVMKKITIEHDRLRNGNFPIDKINEINGITVTKSKGEKPFIEIYSITIDTTIHKENHLDIACELGMTIQSYIMTELYIKQ
jgi:hypothetical protein